MAKNTNQPEIIIDSKLSSKINTFFKKNNYSSFFIVCDSNTFKFCLSALILNCPTLKDAEIIEIEPGEESKDLTVVNHIWQTLTDFDANKKSLIINLGGGVVSDLGGFAASTFKRGIDFINIPTSLLAIADASVGGKTGINFSGIKNHIGSITQPTAVYVNTGFLKTLPYGHLVNGFAEILKIALIRDKVFFNQIYDLRIDSSFNDLNIIKKSIALKSIIVSKDPNEKGLRKILNFGHTVGHAVESLFLRKPEPLLHGEAIAVGMAIESYLGLLLKRVSKTEFEKIIYCLKLNYEFPKIEQKDLSEFYQYFKQDKKHKNGAYLLALLKGIGNCDFDVKVSQIQLEKALTFYNSKIADAS
jgi:3-dehydroquinate synthase